MVISRRPTATQRASLSFGSESNTTLRPSGSLRLVSSSRGLVIGDMAMQLGRFGKAQRPAVKCDPLGALNLVTKLCGLAIDA